MHKLLIFVNPTTSAGVHVCFKGKFAESPEDGLPGLALPPSSLTMCAVREK